MSRILIIDDLHIMSFEATYARTVDEALRHLVDGPWDEVWWDYDLGLGCNGEKITAEPILKFVEEKAFFGDKLDLGVQAIISDNGPGRDMLQLALPRLYPVRPFVFRNTYSVGRIDD